MYVKSLTLTNFRNYASLSLDFPEDKIFITGSNGTGKTNILEAIDYLVLGRSFRKAENSDLIRRGEKEATIYLVFYDERDNKDHTLACSIGNKYKLLAYDGEKISSLSKVLGKLLAVYYEPSQVFFFKEEPAERRKLFDETLSQLNPEYLHAIGQYKKLLRDRNATFSNGGDIDVLNVLRDRLINLSYRIVFERKRLANLLSKKASDYYRQLFNTDKTLTLLYKTSSPLDDDQESFVRNSLELFESNKSAERLRGQTLIGPHRDDLTGLLNGSDIAGYGSQGENRIASLSLRLAIRDVLTEKMKAAPLMLLDDVTSDLDLQRTQNLLNCVSNGNQVFVTGTKVPEAYQGYTIYETNETNQCTRRKS